jgi:hypothetical protein
MAVSFLAFRVGSVARVRLKGNLATTLQRELLLELFTAAFQYLQHQVCLKAA